MRKTLLIMVGMIATTTTAQTYGENALDSVWMNMQLDQVVVTATRTPKLLKDVPVQTRVITANDIRKSDATDIQDLLTQEMPGVEFSYAMNQQTHLNFSGFGGQGILFLIDGERMAGETMDDIDFSRLVVAGVERIEIAKGASSALYGSSAGGGVVNIISKESTQPFSLNLSTRLGAHNAQRWTASIGNKMGIWQNMLTAVGNKTDNYHVSSADNPVTRVIATIYGNRVVTVKDRLSCHLSPSLCLTGRAGYHFRQTVRTADQPEQYRDFSAGIHGVWNISQNSCLDVGYSFDQYDKSDRQQLTGLNIRDYSNVQHILRALFNHSISDSKTLTLGTDYMHDYLFNVNLDGKSRSQHCMDVFAQIDWRLSTQWEVVAALRYDQLSDGQVSHLTPRLNARFRPVRNLNLRMGYGMGFRAPTLKEKYYNFDMSGIWIVEGNEQLKSELSHNINFSADYTKGRMNYNLSAYCNWVSDKIATAAPYFKTTNDKLPYLPYTNLDNYRVYGGEVSVQGRWHNGLGMRIAYALTKEELPKDQKGNTTGNQYIPARPHSLNARVDYECQLSKHLCINAALSGRFLSGVENEEYLNYYDVSEGTVTVSYPAYTIWKLQATLHIGSHASLTCALDNILNYKPKYYYLNCPLTDGTHLMAGINIDI